MPKEFTSGAIHLARAAMSFTSGCPAEIADFRYRHEGPGDSPNVDAEVRDKLHRRTGAIVIGRTMFDVGQELWGT